MIVSSYLFETVDCLDGLFSSFPLVLTADKMFLQRRAGLFLLCNNGHLSSYLIRPCEQSSS